LFESLPATAVTCATTPCICLLSPFSSSPTTPHTAAAGLAFDLACVMGVGDSALWLSGGVGVGLRVKQTQRTLVSWERWKYLEIIVSQYTAVYCDTKLILDRSRLKLRHKLRCDTAYWQHWCSLVSGGR